MEDRVKDVLFYAGQQWGKAPTPDEIIAALDVAGYAIVPKADLAPLWHLYEANRIVGNSDCRTLDAARKVA